ncbi:MAG: c-type cytochrome [bacterium]|nr:c-type cytochrome [bacterium]
MGASFSSTPHPRRREAAEIYSAVGCATCHVPRLRAEDGSDVFLFSDLLLHDVGGALSFRTPPLWGLAASAPYLHDGRAETVADAIAAHGAEAHDSATRFASLSADDRALLLLYLETL